jgi:hypothetical protein
MENGAWDESRFERPIQVAHHFERVGDVESESNSMYRSRDMPDVRRLFLMMNTGTDAYLE